MQVTRWTCIWRRTMNRNEVIKGQYSVLIVELRFLLSVICQKLNRKWLRRCIQSIFRRSNIEIHYQENSILLCLLQGTMSAESNVNSNDIFGSKPFNLNINMLYWQEKPQSQTVWCSVFIGEQKVSRWPSVRQWVDSESKL